MQKITVTTIVHAPIETVWESWINPEHITKWAFASEDWEAPHAENDVRDGGRFLTTMAAKDGSAKFDFTGTYTEVIPRQKIAYKIDDGRGVEVIFEEKEEGKVTITETFEMENQNPEEMQRGGWQAILENFKKYTEKL